MTRPRGRSPAQTLGSWLKDLRPGDPCPWCGASLSAVDGRTATERIPDHLAGRGVTCPALVCSECGSEIDALDDSIPDDNKRLCRAA